MHNLWPTMFFQVMFNIRTKNNSNRGIKSVWQRGLPKHDYGYQWITMVTGSLTKVTGSAIRFCQRHGLIGCLSVSNWQAVTLCKTILEQWKSDQTIDASSTLVGQNKKVKTIVKVSSERKACPQKHKEKKPWLKMFLFFLKFPYKKKNIFLVSLHL